MRKEGGIMKRLSIVLLALAVIVLAGCSLASHTVKDVDKHIAEMTAPGSIKPECIAGFYSGIAMSTDNLKIAKATGELDALVNTKDPEYIRCKAKGIEISILAISSKEGFDEAVKKIMSLGLF